MGLLGMGPLLGFGAVIAIMLGFAGLKEINRSGAAMRGRGRAIAGIVLGIVGLLMIVAVIVIAVSRHQPAPCLRLEGDC